MSDNGTGTEADSTAHQNAILAAVKAGHNRRSSIREATALTDGQYLPAISTLVSAGRLVKTGHRASCRYSLPA